MNAADEAIKEIRNIMQTIPLVKIQHESLKIAIQALKMTRQHFECVSETIDTSFSDEFIVNTLLKYGRSEEEARRMADEIFLLVEDAKQNEVY